MVTQDLPVLGAGATMRECIVLLAEKRGTVPIVDAQGRVSGVITAGDLTRLMEREPGFLDVPVREVMNPNPKTIEADALAASAVFLMEKHGIMALPVTDPTGQLLGIVHLHDLLRANAV